jgi:hypothetical protein
MIMAIEQSSSYDDDDVVATITQQNDRKAARLARSRARRSYAVPVRWQGNE